MKKSFKKIISLIICLAMVLTIAPLSGLVPLVSAATYSGTCGENLTWTLDTDTGVLDIKGKGEMYDYGSDTIPAPWSSYSCSITKIVVGEGIINIGTEAFTYCYDLSDITISDTVKRIGSAAFYECSKLTTIVIPDSVDEIGGNAFCGTGYYYNEDNWKDSVLYMGNYLIEAIDTISGTYVIEPGTKFITDSAFYYCENLENVTIPSSITNIGSHAFYMCTSLSDIIIPNSVTTIGSRAFSNCTNLKSIDIGYGVKSLGIDIFEDCDALETVTLPEGITVIEYGMFFSCDNLAIVNIPNSIECIAYDAFSDCLNLKEVYYSGTELEWNRIENYSDVLSNITIHYASESSGDGDDNLTWSFDSETGTLEFSGTGDLITDWEWPDDVPWYEFCENISVFKFGSGVRYIGEYAFSYCEENLTQIIVDKDNEYYFTDENGVLFDKNKTQLIKYPAKSTNRHYKVPNSVIKIAHDSFAYTSELDRVTLPESLVTIEDSVFQCSNLREIIIPNSTTSISEWAFYGCDKLMRVYYEGTENEWNKIEIKELNDNLKDATIYYESNGISGIFGDNLTWNFYIESGLLEIGGFGNMQDFEIFNTPWEFYMNDIRNINIGNYVTNIGSHAFYGCESLTTVTIPNSITSIDDFSFWFCYNLKNVYYSAGENEWGKISVGILNDYLTNATIYYNHVHSYKETIIKEPTCTGIGIKKVICEHGESYEEIIPVLGHTYQDSVCTKCGATLNISIPDDSVIVLDKEKNLMSGLGQALDKDVFLKALIIPDEVNVTISADIIGTGTKIKVIDKATSEVIEEYTIVIFGDYNGDGLADSEDTTYFASISNFEIFDYFEYEYLYMAADINGDGSVDSMDEEDMNAVANFEAYIDHTITSGSKVVRY